jgi:hypothetical protein
MTLLPGGCVASSLHLRVCASAWYSEYKTRYAFVHTRLYPPLLITDPAICAGSCCEFFHSRVHGGMGVARQQAHVAMCRCSPTRRAFFRYRIMHASDWCRRANTSENNCMKNWTWEPHRCLINHHVRACSSEEKYCRRKNNQTWRSTYTLTPGYMGNPIQNL